MTATEKHYSRVLSGGVVILAALACIYAKVHDATGDAIWRRAHTPRLVSAELVDTKCREDSTKNASQNGRQASREKLERVAGPNGPAGSRQLSAFHDRVGVEDFKGGDDDLVDCAFIAV